ncbi:MAG TPA: transketolase C-terminal domain-containing protein [Longimicrobiales bacterium]
MAFSEAIDAAVLEAMARDERVLLFGEDVEVLRAPLFARFGSGRVLDTPISESAFLGAAVGAAMGGLRPVVEIMLVDFFPVALSAVVNEMAKVGAFSGERWQCPLVVRAACGGGYGDGGQHEQALWGMLAGIPGLKVVVPSTPADAAGLMRGAIEDDGPVIFLEHKLLSRAWLDPMAGSSRAAVSFDVPADGAEGEVAQPIEAIALGSAATRLAGADLTIASVGVGVHRSLAAAGVLAEGGIAAEIIDLRTVRPLDRATLLRSVRRTKALLAVDEDYREFGLTGELAAVCAEAGLRFDFARVAMDGVAIPYDRAREDAALPSVGRIVETALTLCVRKRQAVTVPPD